ncbi:MAG: M50 family metallopeptidase [Vulcanimicrobiaceae bacterium]
MLFALITLASIVKIVDFLIMLSVLVVLHEYGHFLIARRNGVRVNEFAVGMGPKMFGWTSPRSGTLYSVRALPIGGYCAMEGEDGKSSEAEQQREFRDRSGIQVGATAPSAVNFQSKTPWQRLAIVLAGPIANFILCYAILVIGAFAFGVMGNTPTAVVGDVKAGYPASAIGLHVGDRIVAIDGTRIRDGNQVVSIMHASKGKRLDLVYDRSGARRETFVTPVACTPGSKLGCIGIIPASQFTHVAPAAALAISGQEFLGIADQTFSSIGLLVMHFTQYASQVSGPIGMGQAAGVVQDFGWGPYLMLAATISFALGLFNLLPIPALDGGRAAFIIAELLRGKPVDPEKEAMVHIGGFAVLIVLMLLVAAHDIARIVAGKGVF